MVATEHRQMTDNMTNGLLLIEGEVADATRIMEALTKPGQPHIEWAQSLAECLQRLKKNGISAILLNLFLPDSRGIDTFDKAFAAARDTPILALCGANNEGAGKLAVERGAHDFLLKDHLDSYSLTRAVNGMIERGNTADALFVEKERAEVTLNSIGDAVLSTDIKGNVTYLNAVAEAMTGWTRAEAAGRPLAEVFNIIDGTTREPSDNPMALAVRENKTVSLTANCILI